MGTRHKTTVTHLEMRAPPALHCPKPMRQYALMRVQKPPLHFYRYLHDTIGRDYIWVSRRRMSDDALSNIIHDEEVRVYVLYVEGAPAGFFELDARSKKTIELSFLGVMPDFIGRGLGRFLLYEAITTAWSLGPERVVVQTCTLDHPRALPLYQRNGFTPYAQEEAVLEELD